jgi:putative ABC transport system permease protein
MTLNLPKQILQANHPHPVAIGEIVSIAIEALWSNKLRTLLTMLGVIIGIASVIALTSVGLEFRLKNQTVKSSLIIRTHKKKT